MPKKKVLNKPYPIVEITWKDHFHLSSGWTDPPKSLDNAMCTTAGYLIKEDNHKVCLAQNLSEHEHVGNLMVVYKKLITKRKRLG